MHEWVSLFERMGGVISDPTVEQLRNTLEELFSSNDEEHPDAWVNCGSDEGPLYNVSIYSEGYAIYSKYSDVDMTEELDSKKIKNVNIDGALELWLNLINGKIDQI